MSVIQNQRLAVKICEMYYLINLSQKEIASRLNISRPHICRILSQARESGIVEIHIKNPYHDETVLEQQLISKYQLDDAVVIHAVDHDNNSDKMKSFFREAADYIDTYMVPGTNLGVMSGKTVESIAEQMNNKSKKLGLVVPLVGGIGAVSPNLHASYIAMQIAQKYGGTPLVLNAPLVVSNPETASVLKQEATIAEVLKQGKNCDTAIVGIGNVSNNSTTAIAGGISGDDMDKLQEAGAVCSICNSYYDENGHEVDIISDKSIGVALKELRHTRIIACAFGDSKVKAILAALKTRYISILITNTETALQLV